MRVTDIWLVGSRYIAVYHVCLFWGLLHEIIGLALKVYI